MRDDRIDVYLPPMYVFLGEYLEDIAFIERQSRFFGRD